jgi:hypothetical protein
LWVSLWALAECITIHPRAPLLPRRYHSQPTMPPRKVGLHRSGIWTNV